MNPHDQRDLVNQSPTKPFLRDRVNRRWLQQGQRKMSSGKSLKYTWSPQGMWISDDIWISGWKWGVPRTYYAFLAFFSWGRWWWWTTVIFESTDPFHPFSSLNSANPRPSKSKPTGCCRVRAKGAPKPSHPWPEMGQNVIPKWLEETETLICGFNKNTTWFLEKICPILHFCQCRTSKSQQNVQQISRGSEWNWGSGQEMLFTSHPRQFCNGLHCRVRLGEWQIRRWPILPLHIPTCCKNTNRRGKRVWVKTMKP